MTDILLYLILLGLGYLIGNYIKDGTFHHLNIIQNLIVYLLIGTMGIKIGSNNLIIKHLTAYGLYAFVFTIMTMSCSLITVTVMRRLLHINRYGMTHNKAKDIQGKKQRTIDYTTLLTILIMIIGILFGLILHHFYHFHVIDKITSQMLTIELCFLLFNAGMDLGLKGHIMAQFKQIGIKILLIPMAVIIGTMAGAFISSLILSYNLKESLAIGGGLGWYSLGSSLLMKKGLITAGAISFMHNIMREILSIILVPMTAKKIGYFEAVSLCGATAMDTCLPVVTRSTASYMTIYSFVSGVITSMAVPILIAFIL